MSARDEIFLSAHVAPSILAADFGRLGEQVQSVLDAGARVIHVDIMDGHFVPPISFGPVAVEAIADRVHAAGGVIDVHLMIEHPDRHVEEFARAGADGITIHAEATAHLHYTLAAIRDAGCRAGVALCPATRPDVLLEVAAQTLDLALCMSVNPGWGGQRFIEHSTDKLARMRAALPEHVALEVDGGIDEETIERCARAGCNLFVAGSSVFGTEDPGESFRRLTALVG
jgi:ribulose-phosphate 3-epimerase